MQNSSESIKIFFSNIVRCGNAVLNCTKDVIVGLFPNDGYCEMRRYIRKDDLYENALEVRIDKATLLCYFDGEGKCDACLVFFDNTDEVGAYVDLCNRMFEYCSTSRRWKLATSFISYFEEDDDKYFGFFAPRL